MASSLNYWLCDYLLITDQQAPDDKWEVELWRYLNKHPERQRWGAVHSRKGCYDPWASKPPWNNARSRTRNVQGTTEHLPERKERCVAQHQTEALQDHGASHTSLSRGKQGRRGDKKGGGHSEERGAGAGTVWGGRGRKQWIQCPQWLQLSHVFNHITHTSFLHLFICTTGFCTIAIIYTHYVRRIFIKLQNHFARYSHSDLTDHISTQISLETRKAPPSPLPLP